MEITYHAKYTHLVCVVFFLFYTVNAKKTVDDVPLYLCSTENITSAKFRRSLNTVLNNLVNNKSSSSNGFNTTVSGKTPYRVYGLLQCWGDTTDEECFNCSKSAGISVRQNCPNSIGARACIHKCFIRYHNYSFFGKLDTNSSAAYNGRKITGDSEEFSTAVRELFKRLSDEALKSPRRYSTGSTDPESSTVPLIYGLVQCWSDLTSLKDCNTCLIKAIVNVLNATENGTHPGGEVALGSCVARYATYSFNNPVSAPSQSPIPLLSPPRKSKKSSNKIGIILGILGGFCVVLLPFMFAIRRKFISAALRKEDPDTEVFLAIGEEHGMMFNLENIKAATRDFHEDNKLGEGGFGSVYKGTMVDGKQIAVKKLSLQSLQGKKEFLNEIKLVAEIQHRNLVKILGCCAEKLELLLVYELMANKSLDKILFDPERRKELDWPKRLNIICGIVRGLLYLHEDSHIRIIHRDIKASNILLDEKMEPKISDFGLARLIHQDESHVETRVAGTFGYMAPEYAMLGQLSTKADVYSLGVVILEIICGRKNTDNGLSPKFRTLIELVWKYYNEGNIVDVIDREIIENFSIEQVSRCIYVGLLCTQADATLRPPMTIVYTMISNPLVDNLLDPSIPSCLEVKQNNLSSQTSPISITKGTTSSTSSTSYVCPSSIKHPSILELDSR